MTTAMNGMQRGNNWLITGASTGFGRLLAEYLLQQGATVVVTARKVQDIEDFTTRYPNAQIVPLDVTSQDSIDHAVSQAIAYVGHIDVLVNNAGYGVCGAVEEVSAQEYEPMFNTNLFGLINVTRAFLPHFRERRSGTIVNLSSIGGLIGSAGWGYYNASKFAVEGLSQALYQELKPMGIHVMVVEPGPFRTDFLGRSGKEAERRIADYETTVGVTRDYFKTQAGKQPGDPQRAVEAIVQAVHSPEPPRHLLLGKIALQRFRKYLQEWTEEMDKWQDVTTGADFPDSENSLSTPAYVDPVR
jgi:NAD(P)-dependent dehydrogenase (short-subunit alcohol dehydrogenase family)